MGSDQGKTKLVKVGPLATISSAAGGLSRKTVSVDLRTGGVNLGGQADLVFCIDTTGSMSNKIRGLIDRCQNFVESLAKKSIDWQVALVGFGDLTVRGDKIVTTDFSRDVERIKSRLRGLPRYSGGGNSGESSLEAVQAAIRLDGYRYTAIKVLILITDEPALTKNLTPQAITKQLAEKEILTYVIAEDLSYFRNMATATGGEWFAISASTDFSSVLGVFDRLAKRVSDRVAEVQQLGAGSVKEYLRLTGTQNP